MAPQKRRRREDVEEIIETQSASSSLRQDSQRKKARVSTSYTSPKSRVSRNRRPSSSDASASDESDEEMVAQEAVDAPPPSSTQYELIRDNNWEHLNNADLDDQRASQRFLSRRAQIGDNHAADNAIIEEVTVINFMCHDKLNVKLGPLINFVVGMNGSGKSAVLTAITLCLGGKASATNRGASLKSLIKGGTDQACLIVKLKNGGVDAYQPELFGSSIIVERHFSKSGSSGFRLKSSTGRTISTKKGDVDDMIEYYQLQVDNPMNVLTQDAAKSFIQSSTPKQKYQFFVEGVQLQQLDNDYRLLMDTCEQMSSKLDEGKDNLKEYEKRMNIAQARADIVSQHEEMRRASRMMANQLAWAQVEEVEERLRDRENVLKTVRRQILVAEGIVGEKGEAYETTNNSMERAQASVTELDDQLGPIRHEQMNAEEEYQKAKDAVLEAHRAQRHIKLDMEDAQAMVAKCKEDIVAEEQRIEDANGGAHGRKQTEILEAKESVLSAKQVFQDHQLKLQRLEEQLRDVSTKAKNIEHPLRAKENEFVDSRRRLADLNSDRGGSMAGFPKSMPQLLHKIRTDQGFREVPVGPIGLHVRLRESKWSQLLESVLGSILSSFVVTSKADQTRLSGVLRQFNLEHSCPILIGNNEPMDTTGHEPDQQYETILRVLDIDSDLIKRQLIIHSRIDQNILIGTRNDGHRVMFEGSQPRNVARCYTFSDHDTNRGHILLNHGNGNHEIQPVKMRINQPPRMNTDIEDQIKNQREVVASLKTAKDALDAQQKVLDREVKNCKTAIEQHSRKNKELKIKVQKAEDRVETLQAEFDEVNVEDGRLEAYKTALTDAEKRLQMIEESYGSQGLEKEGLNDISSAKKMELQAVKARAADYEAKLKNAQAMVKNCSQARQIAVEEKNLAIEAIATLKAEEIKAEEKRRVRADQVEEFTAAASEVCERVPIGNNETATTLDAKLSSLKQKLKDRSRELGADDDTIYKALADAKSVYKASKANITELASLLQLLKHTFMKRMEQFWKFQKYISSRSRINFGYLLSERAFRGKLSIDHKQKLLDVHVEPDETKKNAKGRATKTLSGGEKSFSSICLLLALWEAMGAPLRCLDEYDVFMDDVNRDVSSRMIISAARRSVGRQFILITPKALGNGVELGQDVKVHKLGDPRDKGQARVDEMLGNN